MLPQTKYDGKSIILQTSRKIYTSNYNDRPIQYTYMHAYIMRTYHTFAIQTDVQHFIVKHVNTIDNKHNTNCHQVLLESTSFQF